MMAVICLNTRIVVLNCQRWVLQDHARPIPSKAIARLETTARSTRARAGSGGANGHGARSGGRHASSRGGDHDDGGANANLRLRARVDDDGGGARPVPLRLDRRLRRPRCPAYQARPEFRCRREYRRPPCQVRPGLQAPPPQQRQAIQSEITDVPLKTSRAVEHRRFFPHPQQAPANRRSV